jgi:putative transcriptional regulator
MKAKEMYHYTESGLDNVYLVNGFELVPSPAGKSVVIQDIDGLHDAIGRILIRERKVLTGKEVRFLRHELDMSQSTLARMMDVTEQTVRRWEQEKLPIPRAADALLRSLFAEKIGGSGKISEILKRIADIEDEMDQSLCFEETGDEWDVVDEAA